MTGNELREELHRVAERAPTVEVPVDLFEQGRRSGRRRRVAAAAGAVACVALAAGLLAPQLREDDPPVAGSEAVVGVPDRLFLPPESFTDDRSRDFEIGLGAAAFATESGAAVVVSADDGGYHALDLGMTDGYGPFDTLDPMALALSPDGRQLAWGYAGSPGSDGSRPSGVKVADLETGEIRDARLPSPVGVLVEKVSWSADSRWLSWLGHEARVWTTNEYDARHPVAGAVAPGESASSYHRVPEARVGTEMESAFGGVPSEVAVSDQGRLVVLAGETLWDDGRRSPVEVRLEEGSGGMWFHGKDLLALVFEHRMNGGAQVLDLQARTRERAVDTTVQDAGVVGVLGRRQLLVATTMGDVNPPGAVLGRATWTPEEVRRTGRRVEVDRGIGSLSVAADLMGPGGETVHRAEPDWPAPVDRVLSVAGRVAIVLAGLASVVWLLRRRWRA